MKKITSIIMITAIMASLAACGSSAASASSNSSQIQTSGAAAETAQSAATAAATSTLEAAAQATETAAASSETVSAVSAADTSSDEIITTANVTSTGAIDATDLFSNRDLEQTADLSEAEYITLTSGQDVTINEAGVYVITGNATDVTIIVDAADEDKVQLVLDGVTIENTDFPCIYVKNADKVFVTTTDSENTLSVTGTFTADGDTNTDAAIFSKDDLVLNGLGTLNIISSDNGISCKDDLKITGGTINITCVSDALEANDSVIMAAGTVTISSNKDGIHVENDEDTTTGYFYICGGTLNITAVDDGIHATTIAQIDGGEITITAAEGIEGTWIQVNGGSIFLYAGDDGINAARKSNSYTPTAEFNGGYVYVQMGSGDTDAIDSNGNVIVTGGTLDIYAQSPFDYDGSAQYTGGTIIVNGTETNQITNQMMGGGMGGWGGQPGGMGGQPGGGWH